MIQLINNLFTSGFNLTEIVNFLDRSGTADIYFVETMRLGLENGESLSQILERLKFSNQVVTQVELSEKHGNLEDTLVLVERNLRQIANVSKKLVSIGTYPLMLLSFLILIILGLKSYLLPQVINDDSHANFAVIIIDNLPSIVLVSFLALLGILLIGWWWARSRTGLKNYDLLGKLPLFGRLIKIYTTAYFAREWGLLISQGLDFRRILEIMTDTSNKIFREVGEKMLQQMQAGGEFHKEVQTYSFFTPELALMIEYGELKAKLGVELAVYADECWENFFYRCDRVMAFIQPLVFLFVALMIVLIYVAMLLPIYSDINTHF